MRARAPDVGIPAGRRAEPDTFAVVVDRHRRRCVRHEHSAGRVEELAGWNLPGSTVRYPGFDAEWDESASRPGEIAVPMRMTSEDGELSLLYTVTVFGAPRDITMDEIAIETFLPANDATREALVAMAATADQKRSRQDEPETSDGEYSPPQEPSPLGSANPG